MLLTSSVFRNCRSCSQNQSDESVVSARKRSCSRASAALALCNEAARRAVRDCMRASTVDVISAIVRSRKAEEAASVFSMAPPTAPALEQTEPEANDAAAMPV